MEKQYNHKSYEQQLQELWESKQIYTTENNDGPLYSIDTPPPTVSGSLHIGHVFSYTQTDIIARYKRMNGFSVFYPFGFDDNGLATERFVEKKLNISAHRIARSEFINLCLQASHDAEHEFKKLWQSMGLSVDWNMSYSTISPQVRKISQQSFLDLYRKGFVYRKNEPALYCAQCRTSVAQAELDDAEKDSFFNDIVFTDEDDNKLIIGTTRPELLYAVVALLYNPQDVRYMHLKGKQAIVPIYGHRVPILPDEKVEIEKGTGLVMTATFGDKTDIEWFKKLELPYRPALGLDGKWLPETGILAGMNATQARQRILIELADKQLLLQQKPIKHSVNVHERCKKEIEYVLISQWFLNILDHKKKFIDLADKINWFPAYMKVRYQNWVENIGWDWCLSRQRFYGIPFPVWHCKDCKEIILADENMLPVDPQEMVYGKPCPSCKSENVVPDTDVMDTWNTSSITPYICYSLYDKNAENVFVDAAKSGFIPMGMRPQAHDIIRTWAFYTIVKSWMHNQTIPWSDIVISGHVLASSKEKISKSQGGDARTPQKLLEQFSADSIRYWTASGALGQDVAFSEMQIKIGQRLVTKLWNAFRFINEHISLFDAKPVIPGSLEVINEWLLDRITKTFTEYQKQLEAHEFTSALAEVENFFWHDFCDNYLELIKDQLFHPELYSPQQVDATRWTLYHVGMRILQLYAPYVPHITDALYQEIYKKYELQNSVHQTRFAQIQVEYVFEQSSKIMKAVIAVIAQVRKLKTEKQLSLKTAVAQLTIVDERNQFIDGLQTQEALIKGASQASQVQYNNQSGLSSSMLQNDKQEWEIVINL
ncbi:MAG: valine--tRNA ligase [Candidatus Dependentiae bacterium]